MQLVSFDQCKDLRVSADARRNGHALEFVFCLEGNTGDIVIPDPSQPRRVSGLWQATCFEAFVATGTASYIELNFAPSGEWAAYYFTKYREGMAELEITPPKINFSERCLTATVELRGHSGAPLNLAAVIEHSSGVRSYWALAHPSTNRPDFHSRDCFAGKLP
jgi:hypothetical protein